MTQLPSHPTTFPFGFNIIGFASANLGLGVALRNLAQILRNCGFPFCILDIDPGGNRSGHDHSLQSYFINADQPQPYAVNIFFMNPPAVESLFKSLPNLVVTEGKCNVLIAFWELPNLPPDWKPVLDMMNLILAPSRFIQTAMENILTHTPCFYFQQALPSMPAGQSERVRWSFIPKHTVFLFSFDISSGVQKKNPMAVLQAFQTAFPMGNATLILKINNCNLNAEARTVADRIKVVALNAPGVRVIDEVLPYGDVMSLYASSDVFVSLHRAEGLGLGLMECMALGKPVIATAWSGNMDFMNEENSCLVPYTLVPLDAGTQYHMVSKGVSQSWAEPDLKAAVTWMVQLDQSPELRQKIGNKAKQAMEHLTLQVGRGEIFHRIKDLL